MLSAAEHVLQTLADGQPHPCHALADEVSVTPNAIQQAVSRLSRRGVPIVRVGDCYLLTDRPRCIICGRPIARDRRRPLCDEHRHERLSRTHQQMAMSA